MMPQLQNRSQRRQGERERRKIAEQLSRLPAGGLEPIDLSTREHPEWMTRCYRNNRYTVMIDDNVLTTAGRAKRAMVQRHDDKPIPNHWKEMQAIKNAVFGSEATAVEFYPAQSELVDKHCIYWMWVFPEGTQPKPIAP